MEPLCIWIIDHKLSCFAHFQTKINVIERNRKFFRQKVVKGFRYLKHYGWKEFIIRLQEKMEAENVPYEPWYEKHKATAEQIEKQKKQAEKWKDAPKISIVVPLFRTPETFQRAMIESVQAQTYGNWQLCLADGSPSSSWNPCRIIFTISNSASGASRSS